MYVGVARDVFSAFPEYRRRVLFCKNVRNHEECAPLLEMLRQEEKRLREDAAFEEYKEHPRIKSWREAFRALGENPNKFPPSVANLVKRVRSGKDLPFVNALVCALNIISLRHVLPCGGDDLDKVEGDVLLAPAGGEELYVPLGQPDAEENPPQGEFVLMDTGSQRVFCRKWCWKNGDASKMVPESTRVAINVDALPPVDETSHDLAASELAELIREYCEASVVMYSVTPENMRVEVGS